MLMHVQGPDAQCAVCISVCTWVFACWAASCVLCSPSATAVILSVLSCSCSASCAARMTASSALLSALHAHQASEAQQLDVAAVTQLLESHATSC